MARWLNVPGNERYLVSDSGEIQGPSGKCLRPMQHKGHLYVFMQRKKKYVHRAVLEAFSGMCPAGMECRHLDGNPVNNDVSNLVWGTRYENAQDTKRHGHSHVGERSGTAKLTERQVLEIRQRIGRETIRALGREYGVSHTEIRRAALGIKWSYLR